MTGTTSDPVPWHPYLRRLVDQLRASGDVTSPGWIEAFTAIPRHVFVPAIIQRGITTLTAEADSPAERARWLELVYSDTSLVTQTQPHGAGYTLPDGRPVPVATSSSTMPSLMAKMLELLDIRDGHRVLEIGTGTGYNAALLCHRLGASHVVSIDIDPDLITAARHRLAGLGYAPVLLSGDGSNGAPGHGQFDRIIATAAVPEIPKAWVKQLAPGGKILANLRGDLDGGNLCLLTEHNGEVSGPILPVGGHFMWVRPDVAQPHRPHELPAAPTRGTPTRTTTTVDAEALVSAHGFAFLLQLQARGVRRFELATAEESLGGQRTSAIVVDASDGSYAHVVTEPENDGSRRVLQRGPRRLWDTVDTTHVLWQRLDCPQPRRFGVRATKTEQFVWLDSKNSWYRWPLPLV